MAKNNPLFVDSTLLHGDRIGTQFELNNVVVYDGESVVVVVTNQLGEVQKINMKAASELSFQARVWLGHQKSVSYRFVIEQDNREILRSRLRNVRAQYAIIDEWEPLLVPEEDLPPLEPAKSANILPAAPLPGDYASTVASLIEKWGL